MSPPIDLRDLAVAAGAALVAREVFGEPGADLSYAGLKRDLRDAATGDPIDAVLGTVALGSYLFYRAEHGQNPRVQSYWDAITFVTTCLSVGYDKTFACTEAGQAVASAVMTFGPALAARALDAPQPSRAPPSTSDPSESLEVQRAILARLDTLVGLLGAGPAAVQ